MVERAEAIGYPVIGAVADELHLVERCLAVRAAAGAGGRLSGLVDVARLPASAAHRPGDDVLEPAEGGPLARPPGEAVAVIRVDLPPAPAASHGSAGRRGGAGFSGRSLLRLRPIGRPAALLIGSRRWRRRLEMYTRR